MDYRGGNDGRGQNHRIEILLERILGFSHQKRQGNKGTNLAGVDGKVRLEAGN